MFEGKFNAVKIEISFEHISWILIWYPVKRFEYWNIFQNQTKDELVQRLKLDLEGLTKQQKDIVSKVRLHYRVHCYVYSDFEGLTKQQKDTVSKVRLLYGVCCLLRDKTVLIFSFTWLLLWCSWFDCRSHSRLMASISSSGFKFEHHLTTEVFWRTVVLCLSRQVNKPYLSPPVRTPGVQVENTSSVSPACRKRRLKGHRCIAIVADTA